LICKNHHSFFICAKQCNLNDECFWYLDFLLSWNEASKPSSLIYWEYLLQLLKLSFGMKWFGNYEDHLVRMWFYVSDHNSLTIFLYIYIDLHLFTLSKNMSNFRAYKDSEINNFWVYRKTRHALYNVVISGWDNCDVLFVSK
jgi:hypothetical protein